MKNYMTYCQITYDLRSVYRVPPVAYISDNYPPWVCVRFGFTLYIMYLVILIEPLTHALQILLDTPLSTPVVFKLRVAALF